MDDILGFFEINSGRVNFSSKGSNQPKLKSLSHEKTDVKYV